MSTEPFTKERQTFLRLITTNPSSITAGFTVKEGGVSEAPFSSLNMGLHVNDDPSHVVSNRDICANAAGIPLSNWVFADQVHGCHIAEAGLEHRGNGAFDYATALPETDGIYTKQPNLVLALAYADCVPVFFYEEETGLVGIAHAGWKGSVLDIGGAMIRRFEEEGADIRHIQAVIGPSIGACCYKVDERVIAEVDKLFEGHEELPYIEAEPGQYSLDLKKLNKALLLKAGLHRENISVSNRCTSCEEDLFFSHRRDLGKTGRMVGFIGRKEEGS
ncbi:peptidoglycan editing factor PgeF [Bacillus sp. FJAT-42376]|uniref:peptidoglycan editing factor PgeF n=1 Tax=Bacillus sp. FJAT-42376 TaxID=2014076 RepID=UPI000F4FD623|nr:peptidoglycan editing factor PgeF [Bacillus sp. FJAT-42376]AZB42850.1 peptidoglycan editing factor PgeF [Bacillus sp. FJAT-42376]